MPLSRAELERYARRWKSERDPDDAVALLEVKAIDAAGRARPAAPLPEGRRRYAAILASLPGAILERIDGEAVEVERVFCDHGQIEVRGGELVIVELAPGASASELQAFAEPTLRITHEVRTIDHPPPPNDVVGRPAPGQD